MEVIKSLYLRNIMDSQQGDRRVAYDIDLINESIVIAIDIDVAYCYLLHNSDIYLHDYEFGYLFMFTII